MNDSSQRKTGVVLSYVSIAINTIIQLLYTPLLIRMLGQSEYGLYSLTISIIGYLTIMDLGFGNAIIVYTSKYREQKKIEEEKKLQGMFNAVFKVIGIVAFVFGMILFLNVDSIFGNKLTSVELYKMRIMMLILSANLFITFYFAIYNSIISAYEKFTFQKIVAILQSIVKPLIMIPLLFLGFKSISLCLVVTFANVFAVLSNYYYCRVKLGIKAKFIGFDSVLFKTVLNYSVWIFLGIIVDKVNWSVDNFILGVESGTLEISIYSVAATINQMILSLSIAVSGVLLPKITKLVARNATNELLTKEMIKIGRIQYYIIFLFCSGFVLFGKYFLSIWVGDGFEKSYYVALLLIIPASFSLIQNVCLAILQAMNRYRFKTIMNIFISVVNIIISFFLVSKYGAIGAAMGTAFALFVGNAIIMNIYYYNNIKLDVLLFWKTIIRMSTFFMIPIILFLIINYFISVNNFLIFIIMGFLYVISFGGISYFAVMNNYEKRLINSFIYKLNIMFGGKCSDNS